MSLSDLVDSLQKQVLDLNDEVVSIHAKVKKLEGAHGNSGIFAAPVYEASSMTPDHFIKEAETYFKWKGIDPAEWHKLVGKMIPLESDTARWWRVAVELAHTWKDFCDAFKNYEECSANKDLLLEKLYNKRQKLDEPFETFCWDMYYLFHKIDPRSTQADIVERILNSCLPEISVMISRKQVKTTTEVILMARKIICDLNKVRKLENKPLLRARQSDSSCSTKFS